MTFFDLTIIFVIVAKLNFKGEKMRFRFWSKLQDSHFRQQCDFSFPFFTCSLAKSSSLLSMLTILITFGKFIFDQFSQFFRKMAKIKSFLG